VGPGAHAVASAEDAGGGGGPGGAQAQHALAGGVREVEAPVDAHLGGGVPCCSERAVVDLLVQLRRVGLHQDEAVALPVAQVVLPEVDDGHSSAPEVGPAVHAQRRPGPHLALNTHRHVHSMVLTVNHSGPNHHQQEEEEPPTVGRHVQNSDLWALRKL
jgi:hypothetical protein